MHSTSVLQEAVARHEKELAAVDESLQPTFGFNQ